MLDLQSSRTRPSQMEIRRRFRLLIMRILPNTLTSQPPPSTEHPTAMSTYEPVPRFASVYRWLEVMIIVSDNRSCRSRALSLSLPVGEQPLGMGLKLGLGIGTWTWDVGNPALGASN